MRGIASLALLLMAALPAFAGDGVVEINQACAVNTGCFAGDAPGFPVTIDGSAGLSYRLSSSLKLPDGNTTGIELSSTLQLSASGTTIDLNGFMVGCFPGICAVGSGVGIKANTLPPIPTFGVTVRNGSVQGAGSMGISLGLLSTVEDLRAISNRDIGIQVGQQSTVRKCAALDNRGSRGIEAGAGSTVADCTVSLNLGAGIFADSGGVVSGNTVYQNGGAGITASAGATVSGNTAWDNTGTGIYAYTGATLSGNTAYRNSARGILCNVGCAIIGNSAYDNGSNEVNDSGITCLGGCAVRGNSVISNKGYGLRLDQAGSDSGYRENVMTSNTAGAVIGGVDAGANVINGVVSPTP